MIMNNRQEATQTLSSEQQLRARLEWGKTVEDLTLAICNNLSLMDDLYLVNGPYTFTDWEYKSIHEFEGSLVSAKTYLDTAIALKLMFDKNREAQTEGRTQQSSTPITEEQLRARLQWGKAVGNLILAIGEFNRAEAEVNGIDPNAFTKKEAQKIDEFNEELASMSLLIPDLMAIKLRFERGHNL